MLPPNVLTQSPFILYNFMQALKYNKELLSVKSSLRIISQNVFFSRNSY